MAAIRTELERTRWLAFVAAQVLPLEVSCGPLKQSRSSKQNRYLRAIESDIGESVGYTLPECHEWLLGSFYGWKDHKCPRTPRNLEGMESKPVRTTTTGEDGKRSVLTKAEFAKFAQHVELIAAKAGVFVNEPWQH